MTFQIVSANTSCVPVMFICCVVNLQIFLEHLLCAKVLSACDQDRDAVWWGKT